MEAGKLEPSSGALNRVRRVLELTDAEAVQAMRMAAARGPVPEVEPEGGDVPTAEAA